MDRSECWSFSPPLRSRLKYLTVTGWIHSPQKMNPSDFVDLLTFNHDVYICGFEGNILMTIGWIAVKCGADILVPLRVNCITILEIV